MSDIDNDFNEFDSDYEDDINSLVGDNGEDDSDSDSEYESYNTFNNDIDNTNIIIHNNFLNIYEITMLIGYRATQISNGARTFLNDEAEAEKLCNPLLIAEEEFKQGLIPFDIIRHITVGRGMQSVCLDIGKDLHLLDVGNMI